MAAPIAIPVGIAVRWGIKKLIERIAAARAAAVLIDIATDDETDIEDLEDIGSVAGAPTSHEKEGEEQGHIPIPGSTTDVGVRTEECEDCNECEPRDGEIKTVGRNLNSGDGRWHEYQLRIANRGGGPVFRLIPPNKLEEWFFRSVEFDGFWASSCTLVEAKHNYGVRFTQDSNETWHVEDVPWSNPVPLFLIQASRQYYCILPYTPSASLHWYFSHPGVKELTSVEFEELNYIIACHYEPF